MKGKTLCAFLALFLIALLPVFQPEARADSAAVQARLDNMLQVYPSGSYFSQNGQACTGGQHDGCSNCQLFNVPARGNLPAGNAVGADASATCVGFAKYAFYCLNDTVWAASSNANVTAYTSVPYNQVYQKAKLGDYIYYSGHAGIFIRGDSTGYYMYEANYTVTNKVMYCGHKHTEGPCKIVHANNYDDTPSEPLSAWISADKTSIAPGGTVNFNFGANRSADFWLHVYRNGNAESIQQITNNMVSSGTTSYTFNSEGEYTVFVGAADAVDTAVYSDSVTIIVTNTALSAWISTDYLNVDDGNTVLFSFGANLNANFWLHIYKDGNVVSIHQITNSMTTYGTTAFTFNTPGVYNVFVGAATGNDNSVFSDSVEIKVGLPSVPYLNINATDNLHALLLSWNATTNTDCYSIRFYDNSGNRIYQRDEYTQNIFAALLPAGNYQAEVGSVRRGVWVTESNRVSFTITAASPTHTPNMVKSACCGNKLYKLYLCQGGTWLEDKALAEEEGGRLAIVNSQEIYNCIYDLGCDSQFGGYYLGAECFSNPNWQWVDGNAMGSFTCWDVGQPDNSEGTQVCLLMSPVEGTWDDCAVDSPNVNAYVAEFDAVSLSVETIDPIWLGGVDTIQDNLQVFVTFADGSSILMLGGYDLSTVEGDGFVTVNVGYAGFTASREIPTRLPDPDFVLPASLTAIGEEAFTSIDAEVVLVPEGCVSIGPRAFADCPSLRYVIVGDLSIIDIADDALEGTEAVFVEQ